jgi:hypothetical protein
VADNRIEDYEALFEIMSEDAAALIPQGFDPPFRGYLDDYLAPGDLTDDIKDKIDGGALLVNYSGHGSVQIWTHENIFDNTDVALLANAGMYPFVVSMSCLNGFFAYPDIWNFPSLAEGLLLAVDKGAVAAFMPTGMTPPEGQHIMDTALFEAIFTEDIRTLGPAISYAKQTLLANSTSQYQETSETFLLFGDPAMKLNIHLPTRPAGLQAQGVEAGVELSWQEAADCDGGVVAGYNLYRSTTPGGPYTLVNDTVITGTQYNDLNGKAARAAAPVVNGTTYYYVATSVDADGDESVLSIEKSAMAGATTTAATVSGSGGGGGGGCFIEAIAR